MKECRFGKLSQPSLLLVARFDLFLLNIHISTLRSDLTSRFFNLYVSDLSFCLVDFLDQSSGKSSVLESVVGRDFLPRGSGNFTSR